MRLSGTSFDCACPKSLENRAFWGLYNFNKPGKKTLKKINFW